MWFKRTGVLNEQPRTATVTNGEKNVYYIALMHLGRQEFYQNIKKKADSLRALDYAVFWESVGTDLEGEEYLPIYKKYRKIEGKTEAATGYLDTVNNLIYGSIKYDKKYKLMNQPDEEEMGIDRANDLNADLKLEELIAAFERKHGEIVLSECDHNTEMDETYTCETLGKDLRKDFNENFIVGLRNENLAKTIQESPHQKILVIYGGSHYKGMVKELRKLDKNWKGKENT